MFGGGRKTPRLEDCMVTVNVFLSYRTLIASTHVNHNIYITEIKTGKCVHSLVGHRRTPWCLTFHPTIPGLVASGCLDGEVRIWDLHVSGCHLLMQRNLKDYMCYHRLN